MSRLKEITESCKSQGFTVIYASIEESNGFTVKWDWDEQNLPFYVFAKNLGVTHVFMETHKFYFVWEIERLGLRKEDTKRLLESLAKYEDRNGQVTVLDVYWFHQGIRYLLSINETWYNLYNEDCRRKQNAMFANGIEDVEKERIDRDLKDKVVEELAQRIASTDEYYQNSTKNRMQINGFILRKLSEWNIKAEEYGSIHQVVHRTQEVFLAHYKSKQEIAFAQKLKALRESNPKISKRAIMDQLQITEGLYSSIWHL